MKTETQYSLKVIEPLHLKELQQLLSLESHELFEYLGGPTLLIIRGRRREPLVVSCLLHGNEPAGWRVCRQVLQEALDEAGEQDEMLPRSFFCFIGNVEAAAKGQRRLAEGRDFNRIWGGRFDEASNMAGDVLEHLQSQPLFATVDIHNTTGKNPPYSCVTSLDDQHAVLAYKFSALGVFADQHMGRFTEALCGLAPSITIECDTPESQEGTLRAFRLVKALLDAEQIHDVTNSAGAFEVSESFATVQVSTDASIAFAAQPFIAQDVDICFRADFEDFNFKTLPKDTLIGSVTEKGWSRIKVIGKDGTDLSASFFKNENGQLYSASDWVPQMITPEPDIIHQDCLCYILRPLDDDKKRTRRSWLFDFD
ncbi:MAG: hypothetical protein GY822_07830 [Deltaproteobacteria bacterium]|nr:hypothetical protein [Deltaproteobacteria bacterium]